MNTLDTSVFGDTVEPRLLEIAWVDIPVPSKSFLSPKLFCYIFNVNKVKWFDIQSFEFFSPSMSFPSPNTSFHTLRLIHNSKSRLSFGEVWNAVRVAFHSTIIAQSWLVFTKRMNTCQRLIIDERVTVSLISICILTRHDHSEITVYLYQIMATS